MIWKFILPWLCSSMLLGGTITLTSNNHSTLLYPLWWQSFFSCGDNLYIVINGSRISQEPLHLLEWHGDRALSIFQTTPREDLYKAYSLAMSTDCNQLFMGSYQAGATYRFDLSGHFKLVAKDEALSEELFYYQDRLIRSAKDSGQMLRVLSGDPLPALAKINKVLGKDKEHPVDARNNFNKTVLAVYKDTLVICYALDNRVRLFDLKTGELRQVYSIGKPFRGYRTPPSDFVARGPGYRQRVIAWKTSFHNLLVLRMAQDQVYGFFIKDSDGLGVWAALGGPENKKPLVWDNNQEDTVLLDILDQRFVLGKVKGLDEDEVVWRLWDSPSLPDRG